MLKKAASLRQGYGWHASAFLACRAYFAVVSYEG
jgi:hypothetical protein